MKIIDNDARICIYIDSKNNVIISPILRDIKGVPRASEKFIKTTNDKALAHSLIKGLNISCENIQEDYSSANNFWTEATGIKGFATFSKKYKCVIVDYIKNKELYSVIKTKRYRDGSYGYDKEDIPFRVKEYHGKPSVDTIVDQVLGALKIE